MQNRIAAPHFAVLRTNATVCRDLRHAVAQHQRIVGNEVLGLSEVDRTALNRLRWQQKRPDWDAPSGAARSTAWSNRFLCARSLSARIRGENRQRSLSMMRVLPTRRWRDMNSSLRFRGRQAKSRRNGL